MSVGGKRAFRIGAVLAAALLLAGCFDLELTLKLNSDGSGRLSTRAILSKQWVDLTGVNTPPDSKLLGNDRRVRRKSEIRNGQLIQEEIRDFHSLSELRGVEGGSIEVTSLGRTFWGAEQTRVRWVLRASKRESDAPPPDPSVVDSLIAGHIVIMEIDVPCTVTRADPVKLNTTSVGAFVNSDVIQGSTVRWLVPLKALVATPNDKIVFQMECWSFEGIRPGKSPG